MMNDRLKKQLQWLDDIFSLGGDEKIDKALNNINVHITNTKAKIKELEADRTINKK